MRQGKQSQIRFMSNKNYNNYNSDGTLNERSMTKKEYKKYLEIKKKSQE